MYSKVLITGIGYLRSIQYHWWVVVLMTIAMIGDGLVVQGIPALYPFIRNDLELTRAQVGLLTSGIMTASMVTVILGGWLSDVYGARRILVVVIAYTSIPLLAFIAVNSLWSIIAIGVLIGIGVGPIYPVTSKAIVDWLPQNVRSFGMSLKQTGPTFAGAIAAITLPTIAMAAGWRIGLVILSVVMFAIAIVFFAFYRDNPTQQSSNRRLSVNDFKGIAKDRDMVILTIWGFFFVGFQFIILSYLILFLVEELKYSEIVAGGHLSVALIASTVARIIWGAISDFLFNTRRKPVLVIIGCVTATCFFFVATLTGSNYSGLLIVTLAIVMGAATMSWPGVFTTYMAEISGPERSGTAIGSTNAFMRMGAIAIPPLFGLSADHTGSYSTGWMLAGAAALIITIVLFLLAKDTNSR